MDVGACLQQSERGKRLLLIQQRLPGFPECCLVVEKTKKKDVPTDSVRVVQAGRPPVVSLFALLAFVRIINMLINTEETISAVDLH